VDALGQDAPFLVHLMVGGFYNQNTHVLGTDMVGWVEAIGQNVKQFLPGDEVFGGKRFGECRVCVCSRIDLCLLRQF
jgi:NADPH:quinone reductase-like Zn-dependent oxidoreductase